MRKRCKPLKHSNRKREKTIQIHERRTFVAISVKYVVVLKHTSFILLDGFRPKLNWIFFHSSSHLIFIFLFEQMTIVYSNPSITNWTRIIRLEMNSFSSILLIYAIWIYNLQVLFNSLSSSQTIFISANRNRYLYGFVWLCLWVVCELFVIYTHIVRMREPKTGSLCVWINKHNLWQDVKFINTQPEYLC